MILRPFVLAFFFLLSFQQSNAQATSNNNKPWNAYWIAVPNEPAKEYGVYFFRKEFSLTSKPSSFIIHVSADNRYKLFVNGQQVSHGPARGALFHWNYETVDIAPYLHAGENTAAAIVWNDGDARPEAQVSHRTAFILLGASSSEETMNTNRSWKAIRDPSHKPLPVNLIYTYYVAGPGEWVDMNKAISGWMQNDFDDTGWKPAQELFNGLPKGVFAWTDGWMLVPRSIPPMELSTQRIAFIKKAEGIRVPAGFPATKTALTVPANTKATLLLDQGFLTNAYPTIHFSRGKNSTISLAYAEALYIEEKGNNDWKAQKQKGNRNDIAGKRFVGKEDRIISSGALQQSFTSLWWRTYRYVQVKIETKDEALTIDDIYGTFTGYPFQFNAKLQTDKKELSTILHIGWRTARLCTHETYMDCPYYEQLQYVGDTRIQAMVSYFNSGDERLAREAINLIDNSRMAEGITLSRYPTANAQQIPPFSLWWIGMVHDYWMYRPDSHFVKSKLPGIRQVLHFFSRYQSGDGSLLNSPYWSFTDWAEGNGWSNGMAPFGNNGSSAALDLQLLWAYQLAAVLEENLGMKEYAGMYQTAAHQLKNTIRIKYWDSRANLFADTPAKDLFSQHTNTLAILTETASPGEAAAIAKKILSDTTLTKATIYFKYYVHQALVKAGLGNDYLQWLDVWKENIQQGMTTWAEISDINKSRSDCHAWGSHPNIELFRTVLGIDAASPGFKKIKVTPHLDNLKSISGEIPHPNGKIMVSYQYTTHWKVQIDLPANTEGSFAWKGKNYPLKQGRNEFQFQGL